MKKEAKVILLVVIIISFLSTIISIALLDATPIPFIFSLIIYFFSGMVATLTYTPIGTFLGQGIPAGSGGCGCILIPLIMFILPVAGIIFGVVGPIVLIKEIIKDNKQ